MHKVCSSSLTAGRAFAPSSVCAPRQHRKQQQRICTAADAQGGKQPSSVDDALKAANAMLESLSAGRDQAGLQASIDELQEMGYVCDESGCVLVLPGDRERAAGPPAIDRMLSGHNWSLGMIAESASDTNDEDESSPYTACVSGPCWSVPLKPSELSDFVGMLKQLRMMVANLAAQGQWHAASGDRPASRVKWETNHIIMKAAYAPTQPGFSIEITFKTDRRSVTTEWPADVAAAVLAAVEAETGGVSSRAQVNAPAAVSA